MADILWTESVSISLANTLISSRINSRFTRQEV